MPDKSPPPKRVYLQDVSTDRNKAIELPPPNPKSKMVVWVSYDSYAIGDTYNAIAVAAALNPGHIRIIQDHETFSSNEHYAKSLGFEGLDTYTFVDPKDLRVYLEEVHEDNMPHVIIQACRYPMFERINNKIKCGELSELRDSVKVRLALPDVIGPFGGHEEADISVRYTPQLKENEVLNSNSLVVPLVPTRVTPKSIAEAATKAPESYGCFKTSQSHPLYAVAVGERLGDDLAASIQDAKNLAAQLIEAINKTGGSLMITTSARTKPETTAALKHELETNLPHGTAFSFFDYRNADRSFNPHQAAMGMADVVIVTDDSMSMASDAIASGKPFFMAERLPQKEIEEKGYQRDRVQINNKHLSILKDNAYARPMQLLPNHAELSPTMQYNSAYEIANAVKAKLNLRNIKTERSKGLMEELVDKTKDGLHALGFRQRPSGYTPVR